MSVVSLCQLNKGVIGLLGHVGVGHAHSHGGIKQDDSGGLCVMLTLFQRATDISLNLDEIQVHSGMDGSIKVTTASGGKGFARPRRGITPQEKKLIKQLEGTEGKEAIRTQALVYKIFGRYYGQGVFETPVALQAAICNALLDSFKTCFPEKFYLANEDAAGNFGKILGTVLEINDVPVSCLATVNTTHGGIGPNEDLEGNTPGGNKKRIMENLELERLPSIVVEGKAYHPKFSPQIDKPHVLIRTSKQDDNYVVGKAMKQSAEKMSYPFIYDENSLKRIPNKLTNQKQVFAEEIIKLGQTLKQVSCAHEKVDTVAELAKLVSEEAGGITFMTDELHDVMGGVGLLPGSGAVFNLIDTEANYQNQVIPSITSDEVKWLTNMAIASTEQLYPLLNEAHEYLQEVSVDHLVNTQKEVE